MLGKFHNDGSWENCLSFPPPHGIPITEAAFIEGQSTICSCPHLPKFWGKNPKATTKMTATSHQKSIEIYMLFSRKERKSCIKMAKTMFPVQNSHLLS